METVIEFKPVKSSQIIGEHYDNKQKRLFLKFRNKSVYSYENVSPGEYKEFLTAESQGKYFYANIKTKKDFKKL